MVCGAVPHYITNPVSYRRTMNPACQTEQPRHAINPACQTRQPMTHVVAATTADELLSALPHHPVAAGRLLQPVRHRLVGLAQRLRVVVVVGSVVVWLAVLCVVGVVVCGWWCCVLAVLGVLRRCVVGKRWLGGGCEVESCGTSPLSHSNLCHRWQPRTLTHSLTCTSPELRCKNQG